MPSNLVRASRGDYKDQRLDEIRRVWQPGMSASEIARAVDWKTWNTDAGFVSRNAIIGMFHRHAKALLPCELPSSNSIKTRKKRIRGSTPGDRNKPRIKKPLGKPLPEPRPEPVPVNLEAVELGDYKHVDAVPVLGVPGMSIEKVNAVKAYTPSDLAQKRFTIDELMRKQDERSAAQWEARLADKRISLPTLQPHNNTKVKIGKGKHD